MGELGLDIYPRRLRFRWTFDHMWFNSTNGAFWMVGADVSSELVTLGHPVVPIADGLGG
jgi:hypothetical protein